MHWWEWLPCVCYFETKFPVLFYFSDLIDLYFSHNLLWTSVWYFLKASHQPLVKPISENFTLPNPSKVCDFTYTGKWEHVSECQPPPVVRAVAQEAHFFLTSPRLLRWSAKLTLWKRREEKFRVWWSCWVGETEVGVLALSILYEGFIITTCIRAQSISSSFVPAF